ncbi:MAG: transketolase C-terminal domain-containing protein [Pseudomonadota bacterium]
MTSKSFFTIKSKNNDAGLFALTNQNYINEDSLIKHLGKYNKVFVLEESVLPGGLGDEVSQIINKNNLPIKISRHGVNSFTYSTRDKEELYKEFKLDEESILSLIS